MLGVSVLIHTPTPPKPSTTFHPQQRLLLGRSSLGREGGAGVYNFCLGVKVKYKKRHLEREGESLKQQNGKRSSPGDKSILSL